MNERLAREEKRNKRKYIQSEVGNIQDIEPDMPGLIDVNSMLHTTEYNTEDLHIRDVGSEEIEATPQPENCNEAINDLYPRIIFFKIEKDEMNGQVFDNPQDFEMNVYYPVSSISQTVFIPNINCEKILQNEPYRGFQFYYDETADSIGSVSNRENQDYKNLMPGSMEELDDQNSTDAKQNQIEVVIQQSPSNDKRNYSDKIQAMNESSPSMETRQRIEVQVVIENEDKTESDKIQAMNESSPSMETSQPIEHHVAYENEDSYGPQVIKTVQVASPTNNSPGSKGVFEFDNKLIQLQDNFGSQLSVAKSNKKSSISIQKKGGIKNQVIEDCIQEEQEDLPVRRDSKLFGAIIECGTKKSNGGIKSKSCHWIDTPILKSGLKKSSKFSPTKLSSSFKKSEDKSDSPKKETKLVVEITPDVSPSKNPESKSPKKNAAFDEFVEYEGRVEDIVSEASGEESPSPKQKPMCLGQIDTKNKLSFATVDKKYEIDIMDKSLSKKYADQPVVDTYVFDKEKTVEDSVDFANKPNSSTIELKECLKEGKVSENIKKKKQSILKDKTAVSMFQEKELLTSGGLTVDTPSRKSIKFSNIPDELVVKPEAVINLQNIKNEYPSINDKGIVKKLKDKFVIPEPRRSVNLIPTLAFGITDDLATAEKDHYLIDEVLNPAKPANFNTQSMYNIGRLLEVEKTDANKENSQNCKAVVTNYKGNQRNSCMYLPISERHTSTDFKRVSFTADVLKSYSSLKRVSFTENALQSNVDRSKKNSIKSKLGIAAFRKKSDEIFPKDIPPMEDDDEDKLLEIPEDKLEDCGVDKESGSPAQPMECDSEEEDSEEEEEEKDKGESFYTMCYSMYWMVIMEVLKTIAKSTNSGEVVQF